MPLQTPTSAGAMPKIVPRKKVVQSEDMAGAFSVLSPQPSFDQFSSDLEFFHFWGRGDLPWSADDKNNFFDNFFKFIRDPEML